MDASTDQYQSEVEIVNPSTQTASHSITQATRILLEAIGEDPQRDGLLDTPNRVARAWLEMTEGYHQDPEKILDRTFKAEFSDQFVVVRNMAFESTCEHHLLPFTGVCHVGYIPRERVVGLSKIPRLVRCFAKRLQIQEQMTWQIGGSIQKYLQPLGVGVVIKGRHLCVRCRGVKDPDAEMITSCLLGVVRDHAREEFMRLISLS